METLAKSLMLHLKFEKTLHKESSSKIPQLKRRIDTLHNIHDMLKSSINILVKIHGKFATLGVSSTPAAQAAPTDTSTTPTDAPTE